MPTLGAFVKNTSTAVSHLRKQTVREKFLQNSSCSCFQKKIGLYFIASPWIFTPFLKVLTLCLCLEENTEYYTNDSKIIEVDTGVGQKCWEAWWWNDWWGLQVLLGLLLFSSKRCQNKMTLQPLNSIGFCCCCSLKVPRRLWQHMNE